MTCPNYCVEGKYFDETKQVKRVCTLCKPVSSDESRDLAAVAACIASTPAAGNPSVGLVEAIANS